MNGLGSRLASPEDRAEVQHVAIRRWPPVRGEAWWSMLVDSAQAVGAERVCEIGCEYGRHVGRLDALSYTGIDYGYFVEFARRLHPDAQWVRLDFDRYDPELFDSLFDARAAYVVRNRLEHVREPDLLLRCVAAFAHRGAAVILAHHAGDDVGEEAELPPFYRRRLRNEAILRALEDHGIEARVLRRVAAPAGPPLTIVAAGSPEQLDAMGQTGDAGARAAVASDGEVSGERPKEAEALTPESMVFDASIPLLSHRLVGSAEAPRAPSPAVFEAISNARESRSSFSLIRLGNGEGRVIGFPDYIPPIWLARSMRNWFKSRDPELAIKQLQDEACDLIAEADVIGVLRDRYHDDQYSLPPQLLRLYGLTGPDARLCGADIHLGALNSGFLDTLLREEGSVSLVCGHELAQPLGRAFDLADVRIYKVPAQAKFFFDDSEEPHYPAVFERLRETIDVRWPGEVFLVGAGFLGKIYCGWIKRRGGIALDIGSVFDLWAGKHTRGNDPSVAERYSLIT